MQLFKYLQLIKRAFFFLLIVATATSCSKEDAPTPEPDTEPTDESMFYKIHRVENFAAVNVDEPLVIPAPVFFSLEHKKPIQIELIKTARWDMAFSGLYNSFLSGNNGKDTRNHGYNANGVGGVLILEQPFEQVTNIPADAAFKTQMSVIGTDDEGSFGEGIGWYLYDFGGNIRGDSSYDKQHVAYAMPEKRTIVIRTAKGNYAKVKMISCYKDAFTPDKWFRNTPHMFFTFEYVLVPKGSAKFELRK